MGALDEAKDNLIDSLEAAKDAAVDALEFVQEKSGEVANKVADAAGHAKDLMTKRRDDQHEVPADEAGDRGPIDS